MGVGVGLGVGKGVGLGVGVEFAATHAPCRHVVLSVAQLFKVIPSVCVPVQ